MHVNIYNQKSAKLYYKHGSITLTQVGLSEFQFHYQTMCKQVDKKKKLHHCKSQASVNNGIATTKVATTGMLKVQLHLWIP